MSFYPRRKKGDKYGNQTRSLCPMNHSHRSKLESAVCAMIGLREKAGELKLVRVEATVYLTEARIKYIPDFECIDLRTGGTLYIEAKGYPDQKWPLKKRLWEYYGPAPLHIYSGTYTSVRLIEVIVPKKGNMK